MGVAGVKTLKNMNDFNLNHFLNKVYFESVNESYFTILK